MGFLTNLVSATIKVALTPIAVVKDVGNVMLGQEVDSTKKLLESAEKDLIKSIDDI